MRALSLVTVPLALVALASVAEGAFFTGNKLKVGLEVVNKRPFNDVEMANYVEALGYVAGIADAFDSVGWCIPVGATQGQLGDIVLQYLNQHPAIRHQTASPMVEDALKAAFPCESRPAPRR